MDQPIPSLNGTYVILPEIYMPKLFSVFIKYINVAAQKNDCLPNFHAVKLKNQHHNSRTHNNFSVPYFKKVSTSKS